jgi:preprotein translocase subunit Sss1
MRYEMQNFIKFASSKKVSNVGQKPKRDEHKRLRRIARKNKALARKLTN